MRLGTVRDGDETRVGVLEGDRVLVTDEPLLEVAILTGYDFSEATGTWRPLAEVQLDLPLRPDAVFCLGQNYSDHLDEKAPIDSKEPEFFVKAGVTVAHPDMPAIADPRVTAKLDYETELGVVIGRSGRFIPPERALDHVFGYVVVNDLTARDRQVRPIAGGGFAMALGPGKNFEGATRLGSWVTPAAEVGDPQQLALTTLVNGELRQSNSTRNMIHDVRTLISFVSQLLELRPGWVISTGTPGGTGWGQDRELGGTGVTPPGCEPARYLTPGDRVRSEIERVGVLEFDVIAPGTRPDDLGRN
ncbi:MAG: fumarylacetoacetate hydrolase family protein [Actinobacteria bacterium]|nr:fumarylacetoacetate hydrolase family protein [Actinomycetota bacterium]